MTRPSRLKLVPAIILLLLAIGLVWVAVRDVSLGLDSSNDPVSLGEGDARARLWGTLTDFEPAAFPDTIALRVDQIDLYHRVVEDAQRFCVESVRVTYRVAQTSSPGTSGTAELPASSLALPTAQDGCFEADPDALADEYQPIAMAWVIEIDLTSGEGRRYYKYPFDAVSIRAHFILVGRKEFGNGRQAEAVAMPMSQTIAVSARDWVIRDLDEPPDEVLGQQLTLGIQMDRPPLVRFITSILTIVLLCAAVLLPLSETPGAAIQAAIALALGIVGIRQALLPAGAPGFTALDIILLGGQGLVMIGLMGAIILNVRESLRQAPTPG